MHKESNPGPHNQLAITLLTKPNWIFMLQDSKPSNPFT